MSKLHPIVIDPDQWRPEGWRGTDEDWTLAEIDEFHKGHVKKKWITKRGIIQSACPDSRVTSVEAVAHNSALLRDCWATREIVWLVVAAFFGRAIACDPFWNPWGALHPARRLDGSLGRDGFAVDEDGAPKYWAGPVGANGPHSATSRTPDVPDDSDEVYAKGGWLRMASKYGQTEQCAAVVPYRGDDCLWQHGISADIVIEFGRLDFDTPPGIEASSNPGCTIVCLWLPDRACSEPSRRLFEGGTYRVEIPRKTKHKRTGRNAREILVRPGVPQISDESPAVDLGFVLEGES